jgi:hypothetical protein
MQLGPAHASRPSSAPPLRRPASIGSALLTAPSFGRGGSRQKRPQTARGASTLAPSVAESVGVGGAEQSPRAETTCVGDEGEKRLEGGGG